mmetsp:Transcript_6013/g.15511  ORF Transcript_6013/g.15511 Transcript_6013/m.15511 type:complete len:352 (-) Transcript_6013:111-1166(-)
MVGAQGASSPLAFLLKALPPVEFAAAYGSGVFKQFGSAAVSKATKVIDYILAVEDAERWHAENARLNPRHYSSLARVLGGERTARLADGAGLGVHFNPYVQVEGKLCKYGVVSTRRLARDLEQWDHLYLAGRLHKPVRRLAATPAIERAMRINFRSAICAALLLLPEQFAKRDLYREICTLSYRGDVRMAFAEDKSKIENIVAGSEEELDRIYLGEVEGPCGAMAGLRRLEGGDGPLAWSQEEGSASSRAELLTHLPRSVLAELSGRVPASASACADPRRLGSPEARWSLAMDLARRREEMRGALRDTLAARVRAASLRQAGYGFLTTDFGKSTHYLWQKLQKAFMTRKPK